MSDDVAVSNSSPDVWPLEPILTRSDLLNQQIKSVNKVYELLIIAINYKHF